MTQRLDRLEEAVVVDRRPERRDAAENRKRILEAALRLFAQFGVETVSMHQIARAAGVGQGTLYRRYPHKGELCRDLLSETYEMFSREIEEYLARNEGSALERLNTILERYIALMDTKISLLAAIGDACWGERRVEKFQSPAYQWAHSTITRLLAEAVAYEELRPIDPGFAADALLAALSADVYQFQRDVRGLTQEEILQRLRRIFS